MKTRALARKRDESKPPLAGERRAYSVASLAKVWDCKPRTIYDLIKDNKLAAFNVGTGKKGLRVAAAEVERWERELANHRDTDPGTAPSDGGEATPLPTSHIRALASASG